MKRTAPGIFVLCCISVAIATAAPPAHTCDAIDLDQGWTPEQSQQFWFTSQGSRLMPYSWFLAMEVADPASQVRFTDPSNMNRYGYIWAPRSQRNPDGLPIGFVKDIGQMGDEHIGFACAACHTGSLNIGGKLVVVEGGPALSDFWTFFGESVAALGTAATVPAKFDRFSKAVLHNNNPSAEAIATLRQQMKAKLDDLQTRLMQNTPKNPYGNGRVDAFAHIFTRVLAQDLGVPANAAPPYAPEIKAPVSYPFLWDTPQHDLVQWNGSAPNSLVLGLGSLSRNIGEVLGVFGELKVTPGKKVPFLPFLNQPPDMASSANLSNLIAMENLVRKLWSPAWPRNCLPLADDATLARGKAVYDLHCKGCHRLLVNPERKDENRAIVANLKTLPQIRTDPTMAMNFVARKGKTGPLEGSPNIITFGKFGNEASGHEMLLAAVNGVALRGIGRRDGVPISFAGLMVDIGAELHKFQWALEAARTPRYKARPLNGIWATAPYLHNGSVPTLWDLLGPVQDRPKVFYVGSHDFDPKNVGLVATETPGSFRFDTSPQGNWRNGHEFGTTLPVDQKKDLLEFLKTL
jgi:hypothetical protein